MENVSLNVMHHGLCQVQRLDNSSCTARLDAPFVSSCSIVTTFSIDVEAIGSFSSNEQALPKFLIILCRHLGDIKSHPFRIYITDRY